VVIHISDDQLIASPRCEIGENPLWHADANLMVFLDILQGAIHSYNPSTKQSSLLAKSRTTGGLTLQDDGSLLLFQDGRIAILPLGGRAVEVASGLCPQNERFNDVIADPEGRVYAGAMGGNGRLLRFDPDGSVTELFDGLGIPNGMGFSPDLKTMYFTDSVPRQIYCFDYDRVTGNLRNRRVFAEIPEKEGVPDGMTVDAEGYVWTAIWFGGRLKRYAPDGRLDREIFFPAKQTSAIAFGGDDLAEMYVTTASTNIADSLQPPGYDKGAPRGGGLYRFRVEGVRGNAPFRSKLSFPLTN
jgi:sugar lactone lactonase YvrE